MDINRINEIINETYDENIYSKLQDKCIIDKCLVSKSTVKKINSFKQSLKNHNIDNDTIESIINENINLFVSSGTKGVLRGNLFNQLIKEQLMNYGYDDSYEIEFEKDTDFETAERPDFYIKHNNKYLIGFNQYDLWSGGQQLNRAAKYLNMKTPDNVKIVCIVSKYIQLTSNNNKIYDVFDKGFSNNILCYPKRLKTLIDEYFDNQTSKIIIDDILLRKQYDKYYTSQKTIENIKNCLLNNITFDNQTIIEPSAGNGAFINLIKSLSPNHYFYDIKPEHPEIVKCDFLLLDDNKIKDSIIIGNPPFGRNNNLVIKFIKKCKDAKYICFILPKSFNKKSLQRHFNNFELITKFDILEPFDIGKEKIDINAIFMIWKKVNKRKEKEIINTTNDFIFVKRNDEEYDMCIRRVGAKCGIVIMKEDFKYSINSFYKIKANDKDKVYKNLSSIYDKLNELGSNSVGSKSLSQQEIITTYNSFFNQ